VLHSHNMSKAKFSTSLFLDLIGVNVTDRQTHRQHHVVQL